MINFFYSKIWILSSLHIVLSRSSKYFGQIEFSNCCACNQWTQHPHTYTITFSTVFIIGHSNYFCPISLPNFIVCFRRFSLYVFYFSHSIFCRFIALDKRMNPNYWISQSSLLHTLTTAVLNTFSDGRESQEVVIKQA